MREMTARLGSIRPHAHVRASERPACVHVQSARARARVCVRECVFLWVRARMLTALGRSSVSFVTVVPFPVPLKPCRDGAPSHTAARRCLNGFVGLFVCLFAAARAVRFPDGRAERTLRRVATALETVQYETAVQAREGRPTWRTTTAPALPRGPVPISAAMSDATWPFLMPAGAAPAQRSDATCDREDATTGRRHL